MVPEPPRPPGARGAPRLAVTRPSRHGRHHEPAHAAAAAPAARDRPHAGRLGPLRRPLRLARGGDRVVGHARPDVARRSARTSSRWPAASRTPRRSSARSFDEVMEVVARDHLASSLQYGPTEGMARAARAHRGRDGPRGRPRAGRGHHGHERRPAGHRPLDPHLREPRRHGPGRGPHLPRRGALLHDLRGRRSSTSRWTTTACGSTWWRRPSTAWPPRAARPSCSTRSRASRTPAA